MTPPHPADTPPGRPNESAAAWLQRFLEGRTGNAGTERSDAAIATRLRSVLSRRGLASLDELVRRMQARRPSQGRSETRSEGRSEGRSETERLAAEVCDALLNNETSFFRDPHCFDALRDDVLPSLFAGRTPGRRLHIWSAACSSGQEACSLAILLSEHFARPMQQTPVTIHATDASAAMVERVAAATYSPLELARGLSPERQARWFVPAGDRFAVVPKLRKMVRVQRLNLIGDWPPLPPMELVLLRNVLIYMPAATRERVLSRIREQMTPDGSLVLGAPESLLDSRHFSRRLAGRLRVYTPAR